MKRLLLVVDAAVADVVLIPTDVRERLEQFDEVRVVTPAIKSQPGWSGDDRGGAVAEAETRLRRVLQRLDRAGIAAHGEVGDEDPAQAVLDLLNAYPADTNIFVQHAEEYERYREHDLLQRFRECFHGPIDSLTLDSASRVVYYTQAASRVRQPTPP